MRKIAKAELAAINGGISLGGVVIAIVAGFVTGGPVGAGIAASGLVAAKGIDNLNDMRKKENHD